MQDITKKRISFITSEQYQAKFGELLLKRKIMMIMIANSLEVRINRIKTLYKEYSELRNEYFDISHEESACIEDFIVVEEIVYHTRKCIDEMILALWMDKVGVNEIGNTKAKTLDCIRDYINQKRANPNTQNLITEFDAFSDFMDAINQISNSYKHSILDFSPVETDIANDKEHPYFFSYTLKPKDSDIKLSAVEIIQNLEKMFDCFLCSI